MVVGYVNQIIPFSSVDGPGNRTAIFLQGCNFNCIYCHNPETIHMCQHCAKCIKACPVGALTHEAGKVAWQDAKCINCGACTKACKRDSSPKVKAYTPNQLLEAIKPYRPFIQGITVSGGECTLQAAFVTALFEAAKADGLSCFLDTNGSASLWEEEALMAVTDGVMLDVKSWDAATHERYIGADSITVKRNLDYLMTVNKLYEVRTVVVPEVLDPAQTVEEVAQRIGRCEAPIRYKLICYRELGVRAAYHHLKSPDQVQMQQLASRCQALGCKAVIIV